MQSAITNSTTIQSKQQKHQCHATLQSLFMYSESNKNGRKVVQKSSDQHVLAIVHTLLHMFVYMCVHMYDFCKTTKICLSVCMFMCAVCAIVWLALHSHRISHLASRTSKANLLPFIRWLSEMSYNDFSAFLVHVVVVHMHIYSVLSLAAVATLPLLSSTSPSPLYCVAK